MSAYFEQRLAEIESTQTDLKVRSRIRYQNVRKEKSRHGKTIYYYRVGDGVRTRLPDPAQNRLAFNKAYAMAKRGEVVQLPREARALPASPAVGRAGYAYFLRMGNAVKIGFTTDVGKRLQSIQTSCPLPATVIMIVPGSEGTERFFHSHFGAYRQSGEWFALEGELASFLSTGSI